MEGGPHDSRYLEKFDEAESLSWMADHDLNPYSFLLGNRPDVSSVENFMAWVNEGFSRVGVSALDTDPHHLWAYFMATISAFTGVDAFSPLSWEEETDATLARDLPKNADGGEVVFPGLRVERQRKNAPFPIAVAGDVNSVKFPGIQILQKVYATESFAWPALEWTPT